MSDIVFLCGARDYHAMDWYRNINDLTKRNVYILTDLIESEGYRKLVSIGDKVDRLVVIDRVLFRRESDIGNVWRNFVKAMVFPLQILIIKHKTRKYRDPIFFAHSMYYIWLGAFSGIRFVATPQGSDVLIKPWKSKVYKWLSKYSLEKALNVTVDSKNMQIKLKEFTCIDAILIQNGVSSEMIVDSGAYLNKNRSRFTSIRGLTPLYRIYDILEARNLESDVNIDFVYPFEDGTYTAKCWKLLNPNDIVHGRLEKPEYYKILSDSMIVFSVPVSDSSPRSVYEAIFSGCIVICSNNPFIGSLSLEMRRRIVIADLRNPDWFTKAIVEAQHRSNELYTPSPEDIAIYSQAVNAQKILELLN